MEPQCPILKIPTFRENTSLLKKAHLSSFYVQYMYERVLKSRARRPGCDAWFLGDHAIYPAPAPTAINCYYTYFFKLYYALFTNHSYFIARLVFVDTA